MCLFTDLRAVCCGKCSRSTGGAYREGLVDINRLGCKVSVSLVNLRVEVYESFIASWEHRTGTIRGGMEC